MFLGGEELQKRGRSKSAGNEVGIAFGQGGDMAYAQIVSLHDVIRGESSVLNSPIEMGFQKSNADSLCNYIFPHRKVLSGRFTLKSLLSISNSPTNYIQASTGPTPTVFQHYHKQKSWQCTEKQLVIFGKIICKLCAVNLKGKQALVEINLSVIRLMHLQQYKAVVLAAFFHITGMPDGQKNSFFVGKIYIPFDEVNTVFYRQSTVDIQMIFQMTEVSFYTIGGLGYIRV
eukprot:TRINITY_DN10685_c0_g1_i3.p1 TRINITY_DN10685_c0_g1~~TRINITY_DN10685_c0_g1_i3.p1  ORF type:complete len:230 (+),score=-6.43 TRINITY_DN10685_c0_g1_i3:40-729(+)